MGQEPNKVQVRERASRRGHDPERTREEILAVATRIFSERGLNGARVDEIAAATDTSKRMIYYYFESKEGLYQAVLAQAYAGIRRVEHEAGLDELEPAEALRRVVRGTLDYHAQNTAFVRLVSIENIQHARFLREIEGIREQNSAIIGSLARLLARGEGTGAFRAGINPVDLHWLISSFAIFNVANDATFSYLYDDGGAFTERHARHRDIAEQAVLGYCLAV